MKKPITRLGHAVWRWLVPVAFVSCVQFDTTRQTSQRETVGGEVFNVLCERVHFGETPADISFKDGRPVCLGQSQTMTGVGAKVRAMASRRPSIVQALDRTIPQALYTATDALLVNLLPLYGPDNGNYDMPTVRTPAGVVPGEDLLPQTTRGLSRLLDGIAASDPSLRAFASMSGRQGYRPPRVALGLTRALLSNPNIGTVLDRLLALVRDPRDPRGKGPGYDNLAAGLDTLRGELATASPSMDDGSPAGTTLDALIDLAFRSDPSLSTGKDRWLVRRDKRAVARVALVNNALPAPFVDNAPMDGLADIVDGRFVSGAMPLNVATPFAASEAPDGPRDPEGRALRATGSTETLYEYMNADETVLAALLRDAKSLLAPADSTALRLVHGVSALLGARQQSMRDYNIRHACGADGSMECSVPAVKYLGFNATRDAPLVDVVHALGIFMNAPDIDRILTTVKVLFSNNESQLARSLDALLKINDVSKQHPEAVLDPRVNVWDDLMGVVTQIAQNDGLLENVLQAMEDPATEQLGPAFEAFVSNRDRVNPDWSSQTAQNGPPTVSTLTRAVDRTRPDTQNVNSPSSPDDNRSVFQRFLHLVDDLNGARLCNKEGAFIKINGTILRWPLLSTYSECALIRVDNAAVFYLKVIAGTARLQLNDTGILGWLSGLPIPALQRTLDGLIEGQSGITGFDTSPTPQAVNRLVFQPESLRTEFSRALLDPPKNRFGEEIRAKHPGTIFAWEMYNFYNAIRPLVRAFDNYDAAHNTNTLKLFVDLLSVLHRYYATPQAGGYQNSNPMASNYSTMAGVERYEPILAAAFRGDMLASTRQLLLALRNVNAGGGLSGRDAIVRLIRQLVLPNAISGIAYRDGRTSTTWSDGTTPVRNLSLYYLFADAFNGMDAAFATRPAERESWEASRSKLVDTFLGVENGGTATARFVNRAIPIVSRELVDWLQDRIAAHRTAGDYDAWTRTLSSKFQSTVEGPAFSSAVNVLLDVYADIPTRAAMGQLLVDLLDDSGTQPDNAFGTTLTALTDTLQTLRADNEINPLLRSLAPAFQRGMMSASGQPIADEVVPTVLRFLDRGRVYDTDRVLDELLKNMVTRPAQPLLADEPLVAIGDAIAETHRASPGAGGPMNAADFRAVLTETSNFFKDRRRGMEQFYYIVQHRVLGN